MTELECVNYLYGLVVAGWRARYSAVAAIKLQNEAFTEPPPTTVDLDAAFWMACRVDFFGSQQETLGPIGARRHENPVVCYVDCYLQADRGVAKMRDMVQTARDIFQNQPLTNMRLTGVRVHDFGNDARWVMQTVQADITYYEIK